MEKKFSSDLKSLILQRKAHIPMGLTIELTSRCNFNCRHCYICNGVGDKEAKEKEPSVDLIKDLATQAASMGTLWCTLTGGEPLLRDDFEDIYIMLKKLGFLVIVFTNASLISQKHIELFKKYPPYIIEITLYGATNTTYEKVTQIKDSGNLSKRGLSLLDEAKIPYRLKAMVLNSNYNEFNDIRNIGLERTVDEFRFDPFLHLRYDGNKERNKMILSEQLTFDKVLSAEATDEKRVNALKDTCAANCPTGCNKNVFSCASGYASICMGSDGKLKLCSTLCGDEFSYDLKKGSLKDFVENFIPKIHSITSEDESFISECLNCKYKPVCAWCPAYAYVENGRIDSKIDRLCPIAKARYESYGEKNV